MQSLLVKLNLTPALSFIVLRNIANYIGTLSIEDAAEFLEECGVPKSEIDQRKNPSTTIYRILQKLALSPKHLDREMLERIIIESINPSLYTSGISIQEIISKYNDWLKPDGFKLEIFKDSIKLLNIETLQFYDDKQSDIEEVFISSIKSDVLERIAEIRYAYKTLIKIVVIFSQNNTSQEADINQFYIKLFKIIMEDIEYAHSHIENVFGEDEPDSAIEYQLQVIKHSLMTGNYIQPYIYQDEHGKDILYRPFLNLYSAQSEMEKTGKDWNYIIKRMNACYGILEDRFHRFGADTITNYPHKNYIDQVGGALDIEKVKKDEINNKGNLTLYLKSGRIIFAAPSGNTYETQLRQGSNGYLLLQHLISSGRVVPYMELAKHLNKQRENIDSDEERRVRDAIQSIRKALKLKNSDDLFITDYGFGLSCNSIVNRTE